MIQVTRQAEVFETLSWRISGVYGGWIATAIRFFLAAGPAFTLEAPRFRRGTTMSIRPDGHLRWEVNLKVFVPNRTLSRSGDSPGGSAPR